MDSLEERKEDKRGDFQRDNNIGKLKSRMYSRERKGFLPWRSRRDTAQETALVKERWEYEKPGKKPFAAPKVDTRTGLSGLLIFSIIFFILAGVGAFAYLRLAVNTSSAGEVDIAIEGSSAVSAGDVLELQVLVTNRNDSSLELADMVITYPGGTVSPADFSTPLITERIPLGLIEARSARRGAVRAVLLGHNGDIQDVVVELQYRLKGSSVIHSRSAQHTALITTDAMSISIDANTEVTPGQSVPIAVTIQSHASTVLTGVYLDMSFPFGFTLLDSSPAPEQGTSTAERDSRWLLGSLRPGEERVVQIAGTLDGQVGDSRMIIMKGGSGISSAGSSVQEEGNLLVQSEHAITVQKSFLGVTLESRGKSLESLTAYSGESVEVKVNWRNNLDVPINDATIAITLGGSALNKAGVNAGQQGFYRSVDSLLLWDAKTSETLQSIAPGTSGEFTFSLTPLPQSFLQKIRTPSLTFAVHAAGKRLSEQGVPDVLKEDLLTEVKVGTNATFSSYGLFRSSPFGTLGPLPPKVEYETTYAVVWEVTNTTSDTEEAVVRAELPHYVRWVGLTTPANEQVLYDKVNNTVEWHLGTVKAGSGTLSSTPRTVAFALGLVPSATQIGQTPELLRNQVFEAIDTYTGETITIVIDNVDTRTESDEGFQDADARVIK